MTCRLTFCISTFWLNSGGNFVLLRSFASTPVAMVANRWGVPSSSCVDEAREEVDGWLRQWQELPLVYGLLGKISQSYSDTGK